MSDSAKQMLEDEEAIIRENKGNDLEVARALLRINTGRLYRQKPDKKNRPHCYKRIQDYAEAEWGIAKRTYDKRVTHATVERVLAEKCPARHKRELPRLLSSNAAQYLNQLRKEPEAMVAAWLDVASDPKLRNDKGEVTASSVLKAVRPYLKQIEEAKVQAAVGMPRDDRFTDRFIGGKRMEDVLPTLPSDFDLVITSPPYGIGRGEDGGGIEYRSYDDNVSHSVYLKRLESWIAAMVTKVRRGGRIAINVPNTHDRNKKQRGDYINALPHRVAEIMKRHEGMRFYQEIVWDRIYQTDATDSDWGSRRTPNARRRTERVLIFARETFAKQNHDPTKSLIAEDEWARITEDIWRIAATGATRAKYHHPCSFPVELAERIIKIYGQRGDRILDPFGGIGTTAIAAHSLDCHFVSVELDPDYSRMAESRFAEYFGTRKAKAKRIAAPSRTQIANLIRQGITRKRIDALNADDADVLLGALNVIGTRREQRKRLARSLAATSSSAITS